MADEDRGGVEVGVGGVRAAGLRADMSYGDRGVKGAFKGADRSGAVATVVIGDDELAEGTAVVRDMRAGTQESVALDEVVGRVRDLVGA